LLIVLARYTTAAALARLADEGARVALLLQVLASGRGPAFGGLLVAALMVPHVLAAPAVGALADSVRRRQPLYAAGLLVYAAGLLTAAWCAGPLPVAAFGAAIVAGSVAPLLIGGLTSLLGDIAGDRLPRAFGLDVTSYSVAGIAGPAAAALVAGWAGPLWSVAALSLSCTVSAALLATLPLPAREPRPRQPRGEALRAMVTRRPLAAVTAAATVNAFATGALPIVGALIAAERGDPAMAGLTLSAISVGTLVSSLLYARRPVRRWPPEWAALGGVALGAVPFAVLPLTDDRWAVLALFALAGALSGPALALIMVVREREAPPSARTQAFTIAAGLKVTGAAGGVAVAGLVTGLGAAALLLAVAACGVLAAAAGSALLLRTS
jgi:MFS family permease